MTTFEIRNTKDDENGVLVSDLEDGQLVRIIEDRESDVFLLASDGAKRKLVNLGSGRSDVLGYIESVKGTDRVFPLSNGTEGVITQFA